MLLNFRIQNYKSFGEPQEFTTIAGKYRNKKTHVWEAEKYKALKFSAIFGGNASGKSNFVDALNYFKNITLRGTILSTAKDSRFRLKDLGKNSFFEIEVGFKKGVLIYGISIDILNREVNREYLLYNNGNSEKLIYDINDGVLSPQISSLPDRVKIYFSDLKKGQFLLIKLAEANETSKDEIFTCSRALFEWFDNRLIIITPTSRFSNKMILFSGDKKEDSTDSVLKILKGFDTGITDYVYSELRLEAFLEIIGNANIGDDAHEDILEKIDAIKAGKGKRGLEIVLKDDLYRVSYKESLEQIIVESLVFNHCNIKNKNFAYEEESDGTKRLIELVGVLSNIQFKGEKGYTFIIDEIDRSFHSNLTIEFLKRFLNYSSENMSQLIITTHDTNVMNLDFLRQDEVWFLDRDKCGMSNLISLSRFNVRADKVLDKDYLDGRYGGIPNIMKAIDSNYE